MRRLAWTLLIAGTPALLLAAKPDPRLATVRKAWVEPVDELGDDKAVAVCFADRLHRETPLEVVATKADAEVVLRVKAHLPSGASRAMLGSMGGSPSAHLEAVLQGGKKLWDDGAKARYGGTGLIGAMRDESGIACSLADRLLSTLRDAMRKARDAKK